MRHWRNGKKKNTPFAIPITKREGKDHITVFYFCMINLNRKNNYHVQYSDVLFALRLIPHGPDLPVPMLDGTIYQPLRSGRIWHKVNF